MHMSVTTSTATSTVAASAFSTAAIPSMLATASSSKTLVQVPTTKSLESELPPNEEPRPMSMTLSPLRGSASNLLQKTHCEGRERVLHKIVAISPNTAGALSQSSSNATTYSFQPVQPVITLSDIIMPPSSPSPAIPHTSCTWLSLINEEMEVPSPTQDFSTQASQQSLDESCARKIENIIQFLHRTLSIIKSSSETENLYARTLEQIKNIIETPFEQYIKQKADFVTHIAKEALHATGQRAPTPVPPTSIFSSSLSFPNLPSMDIRSCKSQCATPTTRTATVFQFPAPQAASQTTIALSRAKTPTPLSAAEQAAALYFKMLCQITINATQNICEMYAKAQEKLATVKS